MPCCRAAGISTPRDTFHHFVDDSFAKTCNGLRALRNVLQNCANVGVLPIPVLPIINWAATSAAPPA